MEGSILEKIYRAGLKFLVPMTPEDSYRTIVKEAVKLVKADYGSIFLEERGIFKRVYPYSAEAYEMKANKGFISKTFKSGIPVISDVKTFGNIYPNIKRMGVKSIISVPLFYLNKTIGVLTVQSSQDNYFNDEALNALKLFNPLASLAIKKTQLFYKTKEALKTRDLFIAMAAHELRTPLTTINGYVQLLEEKLPEINPPMSRWIQELSWETTRLKLLVSELLEVSRINAGQLRYVFREHDLKDIIERSLLDFRFGDSKQHIIFNNHLGESKALIIGDFDKLLQVVINLLENAVKFSVADRENRDIIIDLKTKGSSHIFSVEDKGKGIAKKELTKIFERFHRGDENAVTGLGLGLYLCKNIIETHHGGIKIKSKEGHGTKVEVSLPKAKKLKNISKTLSPEKIEGDQ